MRAENEKHLSYFVDKVCSIVTRSINRSFNEQIAREHYTVRVRSIDSDCIWGTHPYNEEMVSFFNMSNVVSIHEEIELDMNNPEHKKMIEDYEKEKGVKVKPDIKNSTLEVPKKSPEKIQLPVIDSSNLDLLKAKEAEGDSIFVDIDNLNQLAADTQKELEKRF